MGIKFGRVVTNINIYIPFFEHSKMSGVKATSSCRSPEHRVLREQPATAGVTRHHLQKSTLVIMEKQALTEEATSSSHTGY